MYFDFLQLHAVAVKLNLEIKASLAENLTILNITGITRVICPLAVN